MALTLLVIRLLPDPPTDEKAFQRYISGLTIRAYDRNVINKSDDSPTGTQDVLLGTATGNATWPEILQPLKINPAAPGRQHPTLATPILQHFSVFPQVSPPKPPQLWSVATAIIVVDIDPTVYPPPHLEYPTSNAYDIRLEIERGGITLPSPPIEWNATAYPVSALSTSAQDYMGMVGATSASFPNLTTPTAYVLLPDAPAPIPPEVGSILLDPSGQPPRFDLLLAAVNKVLKVYNLASGTSLETLTEPLTEAQCDEIASELSYNRFLSPLPPPIPLFPPPKNQPSLEAIYTGPNSDDDQIRQQFQGALTSYHAKFDANARKLSPFIFTAGAAIYAEKRSAVANIAGFSLPISTTAGPPSSSFPIVLTSFNPAGQESLIPLDPAFTVPAAYFYALGYEYPPQDPDQRYQAMINTTPSYLSKKLTGAVDKGILNHEEDSVTLPTAIKVNTEQAIRRLSALLATVIKSPQPRLQLTGFTKLLVTDWLNNPKDDSSFWTPTVFGSANYLDVLLQIISGGKGPLVQKIKTTPLVPSPPSGTVLIKKASDLPGITEDAWGSLFVGSAAAPLPDYTITGDPASQIKAFIAFIRKLFSVGFAAPTALDPQSGSLPRLDSDSTSDILWKFFTSSSTFKLDHAWDGSVDASVTTDLSNLFPDDEETQRWLKSALKSLCTLVNVTAFQPPIDQKLRFSYMEALYSRGFATAESVMALSQSQFASALTGTVIDQTVVKNIIDLARPLVTNLPSVGGEPGTIFHPANPGSLVNCIPPANLSPFGSIEYLHEMLMVQSGADKLVDVISPRRGDLGNLHSTMFNLSTQLPTIDLVLESLESLGDSASGPHGAIYDTSKVPPEVSAFDTKEGGINPEALFGAIPEHSSPAVSVEHPAVYDKLETSFTSPDLPYARPLDMCRSYLHELRTNRYRTMRHYRRDITEFALDPSHEPQGFQRNLWRLPVRLEIALEYLQISESEYGTLFTPQTLTPDQVGEFYGFKPAGTESESEPWQYTVSNLALFLKATDLTYCEFLGLWQSGYQVFNVVPSGIVRRGDDTEGETIGLSECPPCCMEAWVIQFPGGDDVVGPLLKLMVFIRLWRKLNLCRQEPMSFERLADICSVLGLYTAQGPTDPDFIRKLVALLMLYEDFGLAWGHTSTSTTKGAERTKILGLWADPKKSSAEWKWAVNELLCRVEDYAEHEYHCKRRSAEFLKVLYENLDPLSYLAGFKDVPWSSSPICTIRFVELLTKIYASSFTVGEILFLFTTQDHLDGDDPFPLGSLNEVKDKPLDLPDDQPHNLEGLRKKLLCTEVSSDDCCESWGWSQVESIIREVGLKASHTGVDPLTELGEHFFPHILEKSGHSVDAESRRYSAPLAPSATSPKMWTSDPCEPFHYTAGRSAESGTLWIQLPLRDEEVLKKLRKIRQLKKPESDAVKTLYWLPRRTLAPFVMLFSNFGHAVSYLVQEPNETKRFDFFKSQVSLFHQRCKIIAKHLAEHVSITTSQEGCEVCCPDTRVAWRILQSLVADENTAVGQGWEDPASEGGPPQTFTWEPHFSGSAFAAILGLVGTGLLGELKSNSGAQWVEMRGGMDAFGSENNEWNAPIPTLIPSLTAAPSATQDDFVTFKNGFAIRDLDSEQLTGAEPFESTWTGNLLVEKGGCYVFSGGLPMAGHHLPRIEDCDDAKWLVTIQRGQRTYILLNRGWHDEDEDAPDHVSHPVRLQEGAWALTVKYRQTEPDFTGPLDLDKARTGFQVKYCGPDTDECPQEIPLCREILSSKNGTLAGELGGELNLVQAAKDFLNLQYTSSLRDIRRTYQRCFKALLFAHHFCLSAKELDCDDQSELDYLLSNSELFKGTSYFKADGVSTFQPHYAWLDFNLLPVSDPYLSPNASVDRRVGPSQQRQAAMFDWWERIFDYVSLRENVSEVKKRPIWLLFQESMGQSPPNAEHLIRHLGIDLSLPRLALDYWAGVRKTESLIQEIPDSETGNGVYTVKPADLQDERWAIRLWHAREWIRAVYHHFYTDILEEARPALWASDDPGASLIPASNPYLESGNKNLVYFVQRSLLDAKDVPYRLKDLHDVNNGLRFRARKALLSYLCSMDRIALPSGPNTTYATEPKDLTDLLLQDVEVGLDEKTSRIEDAIRSVNTFVQRARIGLEPSFTLGQDTSNLWDCRFDSFTTWLTWKRRTIYGENWIHWDEIEALKDVEGFKFLQKELLQDATTLVNRGSTKWWSPYPSLPAHPELRDVQSKALVSLSFQQKSRLEGLSLIGTPDRDGSPSLLAAGVPVESLISEPDVILGGGSTGGTGTTSGTGTTVPKLLRESPATDQLTRATLSTFKAIPMWIQAAIRLGTRFIRVAAAGKPPAFPYKSWVTSDRPCCEECGGSHPPCVDEYYFWLQDSSVYDTKDSVQEADVGSNSQTDPSTDWEVSDKLPNLLQWPSHPTVYLYWTRVHAGRLNPPRRSDDAVRSDTLSGDLFLDLTGRNLDSLILSVVKTSKPSDTTPGFRYDISTDTAVVIPQLKPDTVPKLPLPSSLVAYPWFLFFKPGAPLIPVTPFGTTLAVAGALRSDCQFEAALKWCQFAFDPLHRDNTWTQCKKHASNLLVKAEQDQAMHITSENAAQENGLKVPGGGSSEGSVNAHDALTPLSTPGVNSEERQLEVIPGTRTSRNSPCCPSVSDKPPVLRSRAVFLEFLDILLHWADQLMSQNSKESFEKALTLLNTLDRLLGSRPVTVEANDSESVSMTVRYFVPSLPPLNPRLLRLYDQVADRRALVHNSENLARLRNGQPCKDLAAWGSHHRLEVSGESETCGTACSFSRCQPYRYNAVYPKAMELATMVKSLGASLLSAFEKGDAEYLAAFRQAQERKMLDLHLEVAKNQWRAADWEVQALEESMQNALTRLRYTKNLIDAGISAGELSYQTGNETSMQTQAGANASESLGEVFNLIPDFAIGVAGLGPYQATQIPIGQKMAKAAQGAARVLTTIGTIATTAGGLSLTQAGWKRRLEEWEHQVDTISIEIQQIKRQKLAAGRRRDVALKDLNNHQQQMDHSAEVHDFMRDKFTKHELDLFLQQETAAIYRQSFNLALTTAKEAQAAFFYERGEIPRDFLANQNFWDNLHEGFLAGEKLELALHAMDRSFMETNCREYELNKRMSLRDQFPLAFHHLKKYGSCELEMPEWLFDRDNPGHYMRRIKSVSLSVAAVAGPYTSVNCTLQQLSSAIRTHPLLPAPSLCCCTTPRTACPSCASDPYLAHRYGATEAIATSHGQDDSGLFELSFRDERYLPFELSGAISRWRIEMPIESNMFDFDTLSDVILNVNYTAREGGKELRRQAAERAACRLPGNGLRLFDIRHDFPSAWPAFQMRDRKGCGFDFELRLHRGFFPFLPGKRPVRVTMHIFLETVEGAREGEYIKAVYIPKGREACKEDWREVVCVVGGESVGVYEGKLGVDLVVGREEREPLGCLRFPAGLGCVGEAYLLCEWEVCGEEKKGGKGEKEGKKEGKKERKHKYIFE